MENTTKVVEKSRIIYGEPVGPGYYWQVGGAILNSGTEVLTGLKAPQLIKDYSLGINAPYVGQVKKILEKGDNHLWVYNQCFVDPQTGDLWVAEDDLAQGWSLRDEFAKGLDTRLIIRGLEQRLAATEKEVDFSKDRKVRHARNTRTRTDVTPRELALDTAIIAQYGIEGAEILAEAAANLPNQHSLVNVPPRSSNLVQVPSAIWYGNGRLALSYKGFSENSKGYSFPVES